MQLGGKSKLVNNPTSNLLCIKICETKFCKTIRKNLNDIKPKHFSTSDMLHQINY